MLKKQLNVSVNQSLLKTVDKSVILTEIIIAMIINVHIDWFNYFAFNSLTDLTPLIMFFILTLLHTVSEIGMYGLLHVLTCWLYKVHKHHFFDFFIKLQSFTKYLIQTQAKQCSTANVQFLFFSRFLLVLTKFSFWGEDWA